MAQKIGKRDLADLTETLMGDVNRMEHVWSHVLGYLYGAYISTAVIAVCLLDAAIILVIMRVILAAIGVQLNEAEHMLSKISRRLGIQLEALGSVLICTVMLADRFLFTLQDGFVLTTAIISAVLLTIGIRVVKRHDEENQN